MGLDDNYADVLDVKRDHEKIQREQRIPRAATSAGKSKERPASYCVLAKNCVKGHNFNYTWLLWGLYISQGRDKNDLHRVPRWPCGLNDGDNDGD